MKIGDSRWYRNYRYARLEMGLSATAYKETLCRYFWIVVLLVPVCRYFRVHGIKRSMLGFIALELCGLAVVTYRGTGGGKVGLEVSGLAVAGIIIASVLFALVVMLCRKFSRTGKALLWIIVALCVGLTAWAMLLSMGVIVFGLLVVTTPLVIAAFVVFAFGLRSVVEWALGRHESKSQPKTGQSSDLREFVRLVWTFLKAKKLRVCPFLEFEVPIEQPNIQDRV